METLILIGLIIYFIPTFIGWKNEKERYDILLWNTATGWTLIGWWGALWWAISVRDK